MRQCRSQEINLVMGDLNAKVGKGQYQDIVGPYGLGTRNDRGDIWVVEVHRSSVNAECSAEGFGSVQLGHTSTFS